MKKFLMMLVAVSVFGLFGAEIKWQNDMTQAAELAKKEKKPILILFTGSDWCPPCMKMAPASRFISACQLLAHCLLSCAISAYSAANQALHSHVIIVCQPLYQSQSSA